MHPNDFPHLKATAVAGNRLERYESAILKLDDAITDGEIRKVEYDDIKDTLGRLVDSTYEANVNDPYFWAGRWEQWGQEINALHYQCDPSNLHEVISCANKLAKTKLEGKPIDALREITNELLPLANAMKNLKANIVLGRAPSTAPPKPENPNKVVRTCPCCFRAFAVQSNRMVHHGYQRPGYGQQTNSCVGIRYKPLERSNEGLVALRNGTQRELDKTQKKWDERERLTSITTFRKKTETVISKGDPEWASTYQSYVWKIEQSIRSLQGDIASYDKLLASWKQTEADPEAPNADFDAEIDKPGMKP
jgi:hypothetical protein